jgi:hypothetical protein
MLEDYTNGSRNNVSNAATALMQSSEAAFYNEFDEAAACEDVRRMAQALAPQMSELDEVLKDFSTDQEEEVNALEIA